MPEWLGMGGLRCESDLFMQLLLAQFVAKGRLRTARPICSLVRTQYMQLLGSGGLNLVLGCRTHEFGLLKKAWLQGAKVLRPNMPKTRR